MVIGCPHLDFDVQISTLHLLHQLCNVSNRTCKFSSVFDIRTMASAYIKISHLYSEAQSIYSCTRSLANIENSVGEWLQPCFSPDRQSNHWVLLLFGQHKHSNQYNCIELYIFPSTLCNNTL